jgi:NADH pyrophosphatase NudC (nudix superfamily)
MTLVLNINEYEPTDYIDRKTVKAVIVNDKNQILLFNSNLIGGGVDGDETYEEALHREALEEAGAKVEVIKYLGDAIQYRDFIKKKYLVKGYYCKYNETIGLPTTTQDDEVGIEAQWFDFSEALVNLQNEINIIKNKNPKGYKDDAYQMEIYNREMAIFFIKEAFK